MVVIATPNAEIIQRKKSERYSEKKIKSLSNDHFNANTLKPTLSKLQLKNRVEKLEYFTSHVIFFSFNHSRLFNAKFSLYI